MFLLSRLSIKHYNTYSNLFRIRKGINYIFLLVITISLTGCNSLAPSINILGAYFPDWLFCITGGSVTTALVYVMLNHKGRSEWLTPYILVFPMLITVFSISYWAVFFV